MNIFRWFRPHRKVDALLDKALKQEQPLLSEPNLIFTGIDKHFLETVGIKE